MNEDDTPAEDNIEENEELEEEEPNACHHCQVIPQNFITLRCFHDICMQCAANNIIQDPEKSETAEEFGITCPICQ